MRIINIFFNLIIINDNLIVINWKMGIKIVVSNKNGPGWAEQGFQNPAHLKPILSLKDLIQRGPYLIKPSSAFIRPFEHP